MDDSVRLALWLAAWIRGTVSLDDARDAVVADDAAHDVAGLPGSDDVTPLILALGALRGLGARSTGVALPQQATRSVWPDRPPSTRRPWRPARPFYSPVRDSD